MIILGQLIEIEFDLKIEVAPEGRKVGPLFCSSDAESDTEQPPQSPSGS